MKDAIIDHFIYFLVILIVCILSSLNFTIVVWHKLQYIHMLHIENMTFPYLTEAHIVASSSSVTLRVFIKILYVIEKNAVSINVLEYEWIC